MKFFNKKNQGNSKEQAENASLKMQLKQFWDVIYNSEKELHITKQQLHSYKKQKHKLQKYNIKLINDNNRLIEDNKLLRKHLQSIIKSSIQKNI